MEQIFVAQKVNDFDFYISFGNYHKHIIKKYDKQLDTPIKHNGLKVNSYLLHKYFLLVDINRNILICKVDGSTT